ncbi:MAG: hypothetical protein V4525_05625 [Pseudomonadota bacterium]
MSETVLLGIMGLVIIAGFLGKFFKDLSDSNTARDRLYQAEQALLEKVAKFKSKFHKDDDPSLFKSLDQPSNDTVDKPSDNREIDPLTERIALFDLYNKQIERYQTETRARAGWSFLFAICAMFAGLLLVVWGGRTIIQSADWKNIAGGTAISGLGGIMSAYITKTFLDIHRLSLNQLNRYFQQPVINTYVLTAQRLSEQIEDTTLKQQTYQKIIDQIIDLIQDDQKISHGSRTAVSSRVKKSVETTISKANDEGQVSNESH